MPDHASIPVPLLLAGYCVLIIVASLAGGWLPLAARLTHTRLQVAISFVAGLQLFKFCKGCLQLFFLNGL